MVEEAARTHPENRGSASERSLDLLRAEVSRLEQEVRVLRAELSAMQNSLYWKMTGPLRAVGRRFPQAAGHGRHAVEAAKSTLLRVLPKRISRTLLGNHWQVRGDIEEQIAAYRNDHQPGQCRIVFYTAISGEYDNLLLPDHLDPGVDYVCFTDRPRNAYGAWQLRSMPYQQGDPTRAARYVKMHPHKLFPDHDIAVWLDANIVFKGDLRHYVDKVDHENGDLGLILHPHRECFYEEAEACLRLKKDRADAIEGQVAYYRAQGVPEKQPVFETGFMVVPLRKRQAVEALSLWWQQIERFSRRDQLGLAWVSYQMPSLKIVPLLAQGSSVRDHADFTYFQHSYARALEIPDVLMRLGRVVEPDGSAARQQSAIGD